MGPRPCQRLPRGVDHFLPAAEGPAIIHTIRSQRASVSPPTRPPRLAVIRVRLFAHMVPVYPHATTTEARYNPHPRQYGHPT